MVPAVLEHERRNVAMGRCSNVQSIVSQLCQSQQPTAFTLPLGHFHSNKHSPRDTEDSGSDRDRADRGVAADVNSALAVAVIVRAGAPDLEQRKIGAVVSKHPEEVIRRQCRWQRTIR